MLLINIHIFDYLDYFITWSQRVLIIEVRLSYYYFLDWVHVQSVMRLAVTIIIGPSVLLVPSVFVGWSGLDLKKKAGFCNVCVCVIFLTWWLIFVFKWMLLINN